MIASFCIGNWKDEVTNITINDLLSCCAEFVLKCVECVWMFTVWLGGLWFFLFFSLPGDIKLYRSRKRWSATSHKSDMAVKPWPLLLGLVNCFFSSPPITSLKVYIFNQIFIIQSYFELLLQCKDLYNLMGTAYPIIGSTYESCFTFV